MHDGVNLSFHLPLVLTFNVDVNYFPLLSNVYRFDLTRFGIQAKGPDGK